MLQAPFRAKTYTFRFIPIPEIVSERTKFYYLYLSHPAPWTYFTIDGAAAETEAKGSVNLVPAAVAAENE